MLTYQGIVQNGVIIISDGASLPEGTRVSVALVPSAPTVGANGESLESSPREVAASLESETIGQKMARLARKYADRETNLPVDLAANHDHYIHGTPKRT